MSGAKHTLSEIQRKYDIGYAAAQKMQPHLAELEAEIERLRAERRKLLAALRKVADRYTTIHDAPGRGRGGGVMFTDENYTPGGGHEPRPLTGLEPASAMPVRLRIAMDFSYADIVNRGVGDSIDGPTALMMADALIAAHNATLPQEEK